MTKCQTSSVSPVYCHYVNSVYNTLYMSINRVKWVKVVDWDYWDIKNQSLGDFQNKFSKVTTILFNDFSILDGQSYFNAIKLVKHTIICIR